jgi:hypothetical protein
MILPEPTVNRVLGIERHRRWGAYVSIQYHIPAELQSIIILLLHLIGIDHIAVITEHNGLPCQLPA